MTELLPLFPLGTVLFPGMVLPLHVFEERYRQMVADLLGKPEADREFAVIAIRKGGEVGAGNARELHGIGCVARLRETTRHSDGTFDLVAVGSRRFRLLHTDDTLAYYQAEIEELPELAGPAPGGQAATPASADPAGTGTAGTVRSVQASFRDYLNALADRAGALVRVADIPDDPVLLSYVIAAGMIIDLPERQALLAAPDAASRLKAERALLTRERAMLRLTTSRPATDLARERFSPN
jgi:Lon protease-like protein